MAQHPLQQAQFRYFEGQRLYHEGLFRQAEQSFELFLQETNDASLRESAWYFLVKSQAATDSVRLAFYYDQYVSRYPLNLRSVELLTEAGHRYVVQGEYTMAIDHFERALKAGMPDLKAAELTWWIAETYILKDDLDNARSVYLQIADQYNRVE